MGGGHDDVSEGTIALAVDEVMGILILMEGTCDSVGVDLGFETPVFLVVVLLLLFVAAANNVGNSDDVVVVVEVEAIAFRGKDCRTCCCCCCC